MAYGDVAVSLLHGLSGMRQRQTSVFFLAAGYNELNDLE
jgi:hypothetical protein